MDHPFGWLSLVPPLVAIALALITRRAAVSLLAGVFAGALILASYNPFVAFYDTVERHLLPQIEDRDKLQVFLFTLIMGAMVGVVHGSGAMRSLVNRLTPWANTRRRGQLLTWALGMIVFFDDYANTLLLGTTLRGLCDRLKISREKLAYLVDSTSAPVAGLALVSTWVAGEIGFVQSGLDQLTSDVEFSAFAVFLQSIPYRFYVLWALLLVPMVAWMGRDFGPMVRAEREGLADDKSKPIESEQEQEPLAKEVAATRPAAHWLAAVIPVLVTVAAILTLMYTTGRQALDAESKLADASLVEIFGESASYASLFYGSMFGLAVAVLWVLFDGSLRPAELGGAMSQGAKHMMSALIILWFAGALSAMTSSSQPDKKDGQPPPEFANARTQLYTGDFIGDVLGEDTPLWIVPTAVFLLASVVAFATGTSWGTMGIVMPLAVPLAAPALTGDPNHIPPLLLATTGSVLAGAIFGDHCSPISDTTVLSSQASGCDHIAHVKTQLPYALLVGGLSVLCGTLPVGLGVPVWMTLPVGVAAMILAVRFFGKPT